MTAFPEEQPRFAYRFVPSEASNRASLLRAFRPREPVALTLTISVVIVLLEWLLMTALLDIGTDLDGGRLWSVSALVTLLLIAVAAGAVLAWSYVAVGRMLARQWPPGVPLECLVYDDGLVLVGPRGRRSISHADITRFSAYRSWVLMRTRGNRLVDLLPRPLTPPEAVDVVKRGRAERRRFAPIPLQGPVSTWTVPEGWAMTVARAYLGLRLRSRAFAVRSGVTLAAGVALSLWLGWAWLVVAVLVVLLAVLRVFLGTRRNVSALLTPGSTVEGSFGPDSFLYSRAGRTDEFRYADCAEAVLVGKVLCLRLGRHSWGTFPADLFPAEIKIRLGVPRFHPSVRES